MTAEPFSILGEDRPSRWLITCDHATNRVPDWIGGGDLGLPPEDMARHIAYDVGAAGLTRKLAQRMGAPAILSDFSRLVIDPNRGEDDPTLLMRIYDGTVIPANRHADAAERERRLDRLYRPYHAAYAALAARRPDRAICAVHSFTRQLRGRPRRPWSSPPPSPSATRERARSSAPARSASPGVPAPRCCSACSRSPSATGSSPRSSRSSRAASACPWPRPAR